MPLKECQNFNMSLVTIASLEEQKKIMNQLKKYEKNLLFTGFHWIEKIKNRVGDGNIQESLLNKTCFLTT